MELRILSETKKLEKRKKKKTYSELQLTVPKPTISGATAAVIYHRKMKFIATLLRCVLVALHPKHVNGHGQAYN